MSDNGTVNINVIVADRPYRLRINPEEEDNVRKAAQLIKDKIRDLQKMYDAKDKQDFLAMSALMFAVDSLNIQDKASNKDAKVYNKLNDLDGILSEFLKKD